MSESTQTSQADLCYTKRCSCVVFFPKSREKRLDQQARKSTPNPPSLPSVAIFCHLLQGVHILCIQIQHFFRREEQWWGVVGWWGERTLGLFVKSFLPAFRESQNSERKILDNHLSPSKRPEVLDHGLSHHAFPRHQVLGQAVELFNKYVAVSFLTVCVKEWCLIQVKIQNQNGLLQNQFPLVKFIWVANSIGWVIESRLFFTITTVSVLMQNPLNWILNLSHTQIPWTEWQISCKHALNWDHYCSNFDPGQTPSDYCSTCFSSATLSRLSFLSFFLESFGCSGSAGF